MGKLTTAALGIARARHGDWELAVCNTEPGTALRAACCTNEARYGTLVARLERRMVRHGY